MSDCTILNVGRVRIRFGDEQTEGDSMPHTTRKKSTSGYHHVVPKGLGDQILFENDDKRSEYLCELSEAKSEYGIVLHAYCLMSNHVHLIVEDPQDNLSNAMKFVHERYAMSLSAHTGRKGGVFRRPFWSEPIETDEYLLCAVRYVHANPAAAGICAASDYEWSSARQYLGKAEGVADTDNVLNMLGGVPGFIEFSQQANSTALAFPSSKLSKHLTDDEYMRIATSIAGDTVRTLKTVQVATRASVVKTLRTRGFSVAVISRLTGLGRSEIERYC